MRNVILLMAIALSILFIGSAMVSANEATNGVQLTPQTNDGSVQNAPEPNIQSVQTNAQPSEVGTQNVQPNAQPDQGMPTGNGNGIPASGDNGMQSPDQGNGNGMAAPGNGNGMQSTPNLGVNTIPTLGYGNSILGLGLGYGYGMQSIFPSLGFGLGCNI